jgi:hypothetical protein
MIRMQSHPLPRGRFRGAATSRCAAHELTSWCTGGGYRSSARRRFFAEVREANAEKERRLQVKTGREHGSNPEPLVAMSVGEAAQEGLDVGDRQVAPGLPQDRIDIRRRSPMLVGIATSSARPGRHELSHSQ